MQRLPAVLSLGVKWPGHEAHNSPLSNAEVKNTWSNTSTPPVRFHGVLRRRRGNYVFNWRHITKTRNRLEVSLLPSPVELKCTVNKLRVRRYWHTYWRRESSWWSPIRLWKICNSRDLCNPRERYSVLHRSPSVLSKCILCYFAYLIDSWLSQRTTLHRVKMFFFPLKFFKYPMGTSGSFPG